MTLRTRITDFLFGGPVKRKPLPAEFAIPMLFGNGRDLDDAGLIAFCNGEAVNIRGEMLLKAGWPMDLPAKITLSAHALIIVQGNALHGVYGCPCCKLPSIVIDKAKMPGRRITFQSLRLNEDCE